MVGRLEESPQEFLGRVFPEPRSIRHMVRVGIDDSTTHVAQFPFYEGTSRASEEEIEKAVVFFRAFLIRRLDELTREAV